ncbi:DUF2163 domain-containing protein [Rubrimonas cliftonensis]|uniref:Bacteriophage phiJL001 Gp84 C-terminal domain-containing protein n=1 Tax=Rubrimonas cliftonensis TaxID=89524 RepID=A0A1H3ZGH1_9RHOB|nr:DUF2163 domain-containing protein [Rubrimonas cliftonensis]SEA22876.1 phage conserved hypothetical protein BR0599 [Rubrimonas cliftonensis]
MRRLDPALAAHLASGATTLCDCWLLRRRDGLLLGFTDHDEAVAFDGMRFLPETALSASAAEAVTGMAAGNFEVAGALRSDAIDARDVAQGRFDGAGLTRWRVNWAAPAQRVKLFEGTLGEITTEKGGFLAEALGPASALNRPLGRAYLGACDAALGDARCGVDLGAPGMEGAGVADEFDARGLRVTGLDDFAPGWFAHGVLRWTGGANAGEAVAVRDDATAQGARLLTLARTPGAPVARGDAFVATAGCDKRFATCGEKFRAAMNFRGFPHMPGDDWIAASPAPGAAHDGGSRHG